VTGPSAMRIKAVEVQPGDDVVTHRTLLGWAGKMVMSTRRTVRSVVVDSSRDEVRVTFWSTEGVERFRLRDEIEVERHGTAA
jgi:hypothetical protein